MPNLEAADAEVFFGDLGEAVGVEVDGVVGGELADGGGGEGADAGGGGLVVGGVETEIELVKRLVLLEFDARLGEAAGADGLGGDEVEDAGDGAGAVEGGAAAFDELDAVDEGDGDLFEAVDAAEGGEQRDAVEQDLVVGAGQAEELDLGGVAILAIGLDAHAVRELDGLGKVERGAEREVFGEDDFGADGDLGQEPFGAGAGGDGEGRELVNRLLLGGLSEKEGRGQGAEKQSRGRGEGGGIRWHNKISRS